MELDEELGRERCQRAETSSTPNYRNGCTKKTVKTQLGEVDIKVPRDRNGSFEPKISEKIMPEVAAWQNRPLEAVYPFIFMDAIHYKVREDHRYVPKAAYVVLGITMDGRKDTLGVWIGEHESNKFWLAWAWRKKLCKRNSTKSRMAQGKQRRQWGGALDCRGSRWAGRYARAGVNAALSDGRL